MSASKETSMPDPAYKHQLTKKTGKLLQDFLKTYLGVGALGLMAESAGAPRSMPPKIDANGMMLTTMLINIILEIARHIPLADIPDFMAAHLSHAKQEMLAQGMPECKPFDDSMLAFAGEICKQIRLRKSSDLH